MSRPTRRSCAGECPGYHGGSDTSSCGLLKFLEFACTFCSIVTFTAPFNDGLQAVKAFTSIHDLHKLPTLTANEYSQLFQYLPALLQGGNDVLRGPDLVVRGYSRGKVARLAVAPCVVAGCSPQLQVLQLCSCVRVTLSDYDVLCLRSIIKDLSPSCSPSLACGGRGIQTAPP